MTKFAIRKFNAHDTALRNRHEGLPNAYQARLSVLLLCVIVFAALSYLFYMNRTATGGFDVKGSELRIAELQRENAQLELQVAELQSLATISAASQQYQMVATTSIQYLPAVGGAVAVR